MTKSQRSRKDEASFGTDEETPLVREAAESAPVYDLEERTARFGEAIIDFARKIPHGPLTDRIINQLVGAGTSVGANYIEADDSVSKKEFLKCIGTARRRRVKRSIFCAWQSAQSKTKTGSAKAVDEREGIASDFCEDLADRKTKGTREMTKHPPSLRCGATGE